MKGNERKEYLSVGGEGGRDEDDWWLRRVMVIGC